MKNMRVLVVLALTMGILFSCSPSYATTESARTYSIYFSETSATGFGDIAGYYAHDWRIWLQFHRAIEKAPALRREILKLPPDSYQGRKGAVGLMHKNLPMEFVKSHPRHIFVLQLGAYESSKSISNFMQWQWPKVAKKAIYEKAPKAFRVSFSSESDAKSEPIFVGSRKHLIHLYYGLYASVKDAKRDAKEFKKYLGYQPIVKKKELTAKLARSFLFEPIAGEMP